MEQEDDKPKRRIRYKGTHPRSFKEKYKELQPEKYAADIEKVKQKGGTHAGMHRSICVDEILEVLDENGLDKSTVQERLLDYIIANRLYKKRLEELIKKLKNLDPFELQN
jgi:hypothetical protein